MADDFNFDITKKIGIISTNPKGWSTELNMVSWNKRDSKYDIRSWSPDHKKMGKGITLTQEDLESLKKLLNSME